MTCIVGLVEDGTIYMASDSEASDEASSSLIATPKVAINGDYIIGASESIRALNILHHTALPPVPSPSNLSSFMSISFVQAIADTMDNMPGTASGDKMDEGTEIIVGTLGRIFIISFDYSVYENMYPYAAVGSGTVPALASLFTTDDTDLSPKNRLTKAVKAASEFAAGVRGPIQHFKLEMGV